MKEPLKLSEEEYQLLHKERAYKQFKESPAYKFLCDWLELQADQAIADHRQSTGVEAVYLSKLRWLDREALLSDFQKEILSTQANVQELLFQINEQGYHTSEVQEYADLMGTLKENH